MQHQKDWDKGQAWLTKELDKKPGIDQRAIESMPNIRKATDALYAVCTSGTPAEVSEAGKAWCQAWGTQLRGYTPTTNVSATQPVLPLAGDRTSTVAASQTSMSNRFMSKELQQPYTLTEYNGSIMIVFDAMVEGTTTPIAYDARELLLLKALKHSSTAEDAVPFREKVQAIHRYKQMFGGVLNQEKITELTPPKQKTA